MPEGTETETAQVEQQPLEGEQPKTFDAEYVDKLRKESARYRTEAKANAEAAKRLAEIEEASKTEAQKLTERATKAEQSAKESEAKVLRRDIALEHKLGKADAALLDSITDEDAMRALAARLAQQQAEPTVGVHVPGMGQTPATPSIDAQIAEAEAKGDMRTAIALKTRKLTQPQN